MFTLLAAASLILPTADQGTTFSVLNSLPQSVFRKMPLAILFDAFVDGEGKVRECKVLAAFGDEEAGRDLCNRLIGKRMRSGTGPDGEPIAGVIRGQLAVSETTKGPRIPDDVLPPDMELQVSALPTGSADRVDIVVLVGEDGTVNQCEGLNANSTSLVGVACEQARMFEPPVYKLANKPVRYLLPMSVKFSVGADGQE